MKKIKLILIILCFICILPFNVLAEEASGALAPNDLNVHLDSERNILIETSSKDFIDSVVLVSFFNKQTGDIKDQDISINEPYFSRHYSSNNNYVFINHEEIDQAIDGGWIDENTHYLAIGVDIGDSLFEYTINRYPIQVLHTSLNNYPSDINVSFSSSNGIIIKSNNTNYINNIDSFYLYMNGVNTCQANFYDDSKFQIENNSLRVSISNMKSFNVVNGTYNNIVINSKNYKQYQSNINNVNITNCLVRNPKFTMGINSFKFNNTSNYFNNEYFISPNDENSLTSKFSLKELLVFYALRAKYAITGFQGACYGMSVVQDLLYKNKISYGDVGIQCAYQFDIPKNNLYVASLINYYFFAQNFDFLINEDKNKTQTNIGQELVNALKNNSDPVIVNLNIVENGSEGGHSILAYDIDSVSDSNYYLISVADPNTLFNVRENTTYDTNTILRVKKSDYTAYRLSYPNGTYNKATKFINVISDISIFDPILHNGPSSSRTFSNNTVLFTSGTNMILSSNGITSTITDGIVEGDLNIDGPYTLIGDNDGIFNYYLISNIDNLSINYDDGSTNDSIVMFGGENGISQSVSSDAKNIDFNSNGNLKIDNASSFTEIQTMSSNDREKECFVKINFEDANNIDLELIDEKIIIESDNEIDSLSLTTYNSNSETIQIENENCSSLILNEDNIVEKIDNEYQIKESENIEIDVNNLKEIELHILADYNDFISNGSVIIDDVILDNSLYTSREGSVILNIKKDAIKSLNIGEHSLKVIFSDGYALTKFKIVKNNSNNDSTFKYRIPNTCVK